MILVTLGTQKFPMNRLVKAADALALTVDDDIFIQTGHSTYQPVNCQYRDFVDNNEFQKMIQDCDLLITHAGVGSIMMGNRYQKPIIVVPRLKKFHEHVDNHQEQIAEAFVSKGCVLHCENIDKLGEYVEKAKSYSFLPYEVHGGQIEEIINNFLDIFQ